MAQLMASRSIILSAVLLSGCFQLSACGVPSKPAAKFKVAMVAAAPGTGYEAYNQQAAAGLSECKRRTGTDVAVVQTDSPADYERQIVLLATENYDAVLGIGFTMAPDVDRASRRFDINHFIIIDAVVDQPNVDSITFAEQEGAFLAGALAAMVSKTKSVAFVGGRDVPLLRKSESGFEAGVREIDPGIKVRVRYLESFDDPQGAKRLAASLFETGTDIVYVVAGKSGPGAIEAAKARKGAFVIGADSVQDGLAPGKVLTSVVKRVDVAALRGCLEIVAEKPASGHRILGLADGGIALTDFPYTKAYVGAANIAHLDRIRQAIVDGTIVPPSTPAELSAFRPTRVP